MAELPKSVRLAVRKVFPTLSLTVQPFAGEPDATITVKQSLNLLTKHWE